QRTWAELGRARAQAQASASEERYRRIFEQTNDPILTADLDQVITDVNQAAADAVGITRAEAIGRRIADFISAEDYERSSAMLRDKLQHGGTTRYDVKVRGAAGQSLFWEVNSGLTFDELGRPLGLHVVARDVTERKRWERHQALLVAELNHRVKNTLAVVQSLAHQSFKRADSPTDAIASYEGRLNALAAAHNLLTRENWESAEMGEVLSQALRPFCTPARCHVHGPSYRLQPRIAVTLTLAMHELATNASKYGALSNETGEVHVTWGDTAEGLEIVWQESGGPEVREPTREGFGTRMLRRALAQDLGGSVDLAFESRGLRCRMLASAEVQSDAAAL
ncbi:MAG TPA: HWE histidine kinase domain-containing protein, partial [Sphingomicrobium sp.]